MSCGMETFQERLLCSSGNFEVVVLPEAEFRAVIRSKGPCSCIGALSDSLFSELSELKAFVVKQSEEPICFFECGKKKANTLELHLFLQETGLLLLEALIKNFACLDIKEYHEIPTMYDRFGDYIYFENAKKEKYFFSIEDRDVADIIEKHVRLHAWSSQS